MAFSNRDRIDSTETVTKTYTIRKEDIENLNTDYVKYMQWMFSSCQNLTRIYVSNSFVTNKVNDSFEMFNGCNKIKGEKGTTYNSSNVEKTYARIDGGPSSPGYFTYKTNN